MAEQKEVKKEQKKTVEVKESKRPHQEDRVEVLVRIMGQDIPGNKNIYTGLTQIKGISWTMSRIICHNLKLNVKEHLSSLSKDDIKKIEHFLHEMKIPDYLKNRQMDRETGKNMHLFGNDLDLAEEFDIKRLKKIKSYKGNRHAFGQPVRGQRTRSHFRRSGIAVGVKKKAK